MYNGSETANVTLFGQLFLLLPWKWSETYRLHHMGLPARCFSAHMTRMSRTRIITPGGAFQTNQVALSIFLHGCLGQLWGKFSLLFIYPPCTILARLSVILDKFAFHPLQKSTVWFRRKCHSHSLLNSQEVCSLKVGCLLEKPDFEFQFHEHCLNFLRVIKAFFLSLTV